MRGAAGLALGSLSACSTVHFGLFPLEERCDAEVFGRCVGAASRDPTACGCPEGPVAEPSSLTGLMAGGAECVRLAPGDYGSVDVPPGVKLVGDDLGEVRLDELVLADGASACTLTVGGGGASESLVSVRDGATAELYGVVVGEADRDGITVGDQASLRLERSTIRRLRLRANRAVTTAVVAPRSAALTIVATAIADNEGAGVFVGEEGAPRSRLTVEDLFIGDGAYIGLAGFSTEAEVDGLVVQGMAPQSFQGGGGIAFADSVVSGRAISVTSNADYGALFERCTVDLRGDDEAPVVFRDNLRGVWLSQVPASGHASLRGLEIDGNDGVGIGLVDNEGEVLIRQSRIRRTQPTGIPLSVDGVSAGLVTIGDGIFWQSPGRVRLEGLILEDNAMLSIYVVGRARGDIEGLTRKGLDAGRGIHHCPVGGELTGDLGGLDVVEFCRD